MKTKVMPFINEKGEFFDMDVEQPAPSHYMIRKKQPYPLITDKRPAIGMISERDVYKLDQHIFRVRSKAVVLDIYVHENFTEPEHPKANDPEFKKKLVRYFVKVYAAFLFSYSYRVDYPSYKEES